MTREGNYSESQNGNNAGRPGTGQSKLRFGLFEIDLDRRELRKQGLKRKLPDQAFTILVELIQRPGHLVSRKQLQTALWSSETFVDFDNNLNGLIKRLRETLGDSAKSPRFIETVPRRGYRFLAPVQKGGPRAASEPKPMARKGTAASLALAIIALFALYISWSLSVRPADREARTIIAVLPFRSLGAEPVSEYFEEGLSEEIINQLARLDPATLGIIARSSSFRYRDSDKSIADIGQELGADLLLDGSIRFKEGRLRVSVQLIDVRDQTYVFSETFEEVSEDILELQLGIADRLANALQTARSPSGLRPGRQGQTDNPEALEAYWKGKFHWNRLTKEGLARSVVYFEEAISKDSDFALAYASLADAYNYLGFLRFAPAAESFPQAEKAAARALELQPSLAAGHGALGFKLLHDDWDWRGAGRELKAAISLDPGRAITHHWIAGYYSIHGRHGEAVEESEEARRLDPLSLFVNVDLAWYYYYAGRYEDALRHSRHMIELDAAAGSLWQCVELSLRQLGRQDEAVQSLREYLDWAKAPALLIESLDKTVAATGSSSVWKWLAETLESRAKPGRAPTYLLAVNFAMLGNQEKALFWLREGVDRKAGFVPYMAVDPAFSELRSDPRFQDLLTQVGLAAD